MPVQVKVRVCAWGAPLLVRLIVAEAAWLKGTLVVLVPAPMLPGSTRLKLPDASVPPAKVPVSAPMSAEPLQSSASLTRFMSPTRWVATAREYDPGAVTLNETLCCAVPGVSRVVKAPTSALMFQAKRLFTWVAVLIWTATDEVLEPPAFPASAVLPAVLTEKPEIDCAAAGPAAIHEAPSSSVATAAIGNREPTLS